MRFSDLAVMAVIVVGISILFFAIIFGSKDDNVVYRYAKTEIVPYSTVINPIGCKSRINIFQFSNNTPSSIMAQRINAECNYRRIEDQTIYSQNRVTSFVSDTKLRNTQIIKIINDHGGTFIADDLIIHYPLRDLPDETIYYVEDEELKFLSSDKKNSSLNRISSKGIDIGEIEGIKLTRKDNNLFLNNNLIFTISEKIIGPMGDSEFKLVPAIKKKERRVISSPQLIPFTIFQTNNKNMIPSKMRTAIDTIINLNSEYDYIYFDEADRSSFILDNFGDEIFKLYDSLIPGAFRADFFRAAYLYLNGGVYLDSSMVAVTSLREVLRVDDTFVSPEDGNATIKRSHPHIYNAFIAATPKHPIMKLYLDKIIENVRNKDYSQTDLGITGPRTLGYAFVEHTGKELKPLKDYGNGIRILKRSGGGILSKYDNRILDENERVIFFAKYRGYYSDQKKYNGKRYGNFFKQKKVFKD